MNKNLKNIRRLQKFMRIKVEQNKKLTLVDSSRQFFDDSFADYLVKKEKTWQDYAKNCRNWLRVFGKI